MNKTEAAKFLGKKERSVERYVSAGKLPARYEQGKTGQVLVFDQADLEAFKAKMETPVIVGANLSDKARQASTNSVSDVDGEVTGEGSTEGPTSALARVDGADGINRAALMRAVLTLAQMGSDKGRQAVSVPVEAKLILTLPEAQAMTGYSRDRLKEAISDGALKAHKEGRAWRIKRADLDKFVEAL